MNLSEVVKLSHEESKLLHIYMEHIRQNGYIYLDPDNVKRLEPYFDKSIIYKIAKQFLYPVDFDEQFFSEILGLNVSNLSQESMKKFQIMLDKYDLPFQKRRIIPDWLAPETAYFDTQPPLYTPLYNPPVHRGGLTPLSKTDIIPPKQYDFYFTDLYKITSLKEELETAIKSWKGSMIGNFKLQLKKLMKPNDFKKCKKLLDTEITTEELGNILLDTSIDIVVPDNFELLINHRSFEVLFFVFNRKRIFEKYNFLVINNKSNKSKEVNSVVRKNSISGITKKKNDRNFQTSNEHDHPMVAYTKTLKHVSKIKDQLTEEQAEKLMQKYDSKLIRSKIDALDNMKGCEKKYNSVYLTLNNWCKMNNKQNEKTNGQLQTKYKKVL